MTGTAESMLVVDDDDDLRERLVRAFRDRGFAAHGAAGMAQALSAAERRPPDRVVLDLRMPGPSGLEVLCRLRQVHARVRTVVLTGYGSLAATVDAMRLGAVNVIAKPADADSILAAFERAERPPMQANDASYRPPSLHRLEWEHMQRVLAEAGGNVSEAARRLGLHRRSLQRKLQKRPPAE